MFDLIRFLDQYKISYITHGVNVKRNEINLNCPFCAKTNNPDPSFHLGVDVERSWFSCWRNRKFHRGRTLHRLIMALAACSYNQACEILGQSPIWVNGEQFETLSFDEPTTAPPPQLEFPVEFRAIDHSPGSARFVSYLMESRGFQPENIPRVVSRYKLQCALRGPYKDRVIIPNYIDQKLVNWTARSIYPQAAVRYLSLSDFQGAMTSIKRCVYNSDALLKGGSILLVVEGPFDAIKVDFYGSRFGVRATCLFNKKATMTQLGYLGELSNLFTKIVPLFDRGELLDQRDLLDQLSWLPSESLAEWSCPEHVKDPGDLTPDDVRVLCGQLTEALL
jgi:hypothetical protein